MGPPPPSPPFFFDPSPAELTALWTNWPQLADLRPAGQRAVRGWQQAVSRLTASARLEMISCCLAQQSRSSPLSLADEVGAAAIVVGGAVRHEAVRGLLGGGLRALAAAWHWDDSRLQLALTALRGLVGPPIAFSSSALPAQRGLDDPRGGSRFPHSVVLFGAALAVGWPWAAALAVFSSVTVGSFCNDGRGFITAYGLQLSPERLHDGPWREGLVAPREECGPPVRIWFDANGAVFLQCSSSLRVSRPVRPEPARGASGVVSRPGQRQGLRADTRWFPAYVQMPLDEHQHIVIAKHLITSVFERRHVWARLIPMDGVTRALVFGKACYPRIGWRTIASWKPNHPGWDNAEAKAATGHQFAQWLFAGHLEYVPPDAPPPLIIEPQGYVPKKGKVKFRNITDARIGNKTLDDWGVRYFSARDFGDALSPCAIGFVEDVVEGYHLIYLPGCIGDLIWGWGVRGVRLVFPCDPEYDSGSDGDEVADDTTARRPPRRPPETPSQPPEEPSQPPKKPAQARRPVQRLVFGWRLFVGCTPYSCSGTCDKAHAGADFDGIIMRWAVPHFGQKPAGSVLNAVALCLLRYMALRNPAPGERRGASVRTGNGVVWVDDFAFWTVVVAHPTCAGLMGGCPVCLEHLPHAQRLAAFWKDLCGQLGVPLSDDKYQAPGQRPGYAGFDFDTVRGVVLIQPDKLAKLLACLADWQELAEVTPRALDSIQGRVLHYSYAIRYLRVVATQIYCLLGSVPDDLYDRPVAVGAEMRALAQEASMLVERFHSAGRPIWGRVPSSLLRVFQLEPAVGGLSFVLTWDASPSGWAALLRWWVAVGSRAELKELLLVGSWPAGEAVGEQAHREALAAPLALQAACQAVDLRVRFGLLRNDAEAAIGALAKGSTGSPDMQRQAVRLNRLAYEHELDLLLMHVPGLALVEEGIDGASRAGTHFGSDANLAHVLGPRVGNDLWATIRSLIAPLRWEVTVDLFATESNARAARFFSRFSEPGAEAVDALSVLDWASSQCPVCGKQHREVGYAYPPPPLIQQFVKKAIADAMLCVVVVPVAVTAPYWHKLVRSSLLDSKPAVDGFFRVRNPQKSVEGATGALPSELAVFACDFSRLHPRADLPGPHRCAGFSAQRPRPPCRSHGDLADRRRLREAMLSRPAGWPDGAPGGAH